MRLEKTFSFRNIWIGAAMLWIMLFHSGFQTESVVMHYLKFFGYGGVDICLFASGIGCYYSLEKNSDILAFLRRRIIRLAPVYMCFIIPWLVWRCVTTNFPARAVLGNLLGIQTFVSWDYHFNWYVGSLVVSYLSMPYLKRLTDSCKKFWQDMLVILILTAVSVPFWGENVNSIIILARLPVLYVGTVYAKKAKEGFVLRGKDYIRSLLMMTTGVGLLGLFLQYDYDTVLSYGLYWYPFVLIAPGACIFLSIIADKMGKTVYLRWIIKFLRVIGIYSFEVYLIHVFLYEEIMPKLVDNISGVPNQLLWILTLPVIAAGSFALNRAGACFSYLIRKSVKTIKAGL